MGCSFSTASIEKLPMPIPFITDLLGYTRDELLVDDDGKPKRLPWEDWREGEDVHTSAWMRATAPSGSAQYEDHVAWAGELGYGVRPPEHGQRLDEEILVATDEAQADDPEAQVLHGVDAQTHGEINPQGHPHVGEGDVHA